MKFLNKLKTTITEFFYVDSEFLVEHEKRMNKFLSIVMLISFCIYLIVMNTSHATIAKEESLSNVMTISMGIFLATTIVFVYFSWFSKRFHPIVKYIAMAVFVYYEVMAFSILPDISGILTMMLPCIVGIAYCSVKLTAMNLILTDAIALIVIFDVYHEFFSNETTSDTGYLIFSLVWFSIFPLFVTGKFRVLLVKQGEYVKEKTQIESDLALAARIQQDMLPHENPAFPNHKELELCADMTACREVGGDFYDYFELKNNRIAIVIADVSGKGVPASLFMSKSMTLIRTYAKTSDNPGEVFERVNDELCHGNDEEIFVTAWLGILDLNTHTLRYANAGHCLPAISQNGNSYHSLKGKSMVLAGMKGLHFREYETTFLPRDTLLLYTDGVTEAFDTDGGMFGTEHLIATLDNAYKNCDNSSCLVKRLSNDVAAFANGAEQSDDITMLVLQYKAE